MSINGMAFSLAWSVGVTTPIEGLVVALASVFGGSGGDFEGAPPDVPSGGSVVMLRSGLLLDWYPRPKGIWHLGASVGPSLLAISDGLDRFYEASEVSLSLLGGVDLWIGPQHSAGWQVVGTFSPTSEALDRDQNPTGYRIGAASVIVEWSFLYH